MISVGEQRELILDKWVHGGLCLTFHDAKTWLVSGGIPGERVVVEVERIAKKVVFARTVKVREHSSDRVVPPCSYVDSCGGCDLQHVRVSAQRQAKRAVVVDSLKRIGGLRDANNVVEQTRALGGSLLSESGLAWRSRITMRSDAKGKWGFYAERSHEVVPVQECLVAESSVNAVISSLPHDRARVTIAAGTRGDTGIDAQEVLHTVVGVDGHVWEWRLPAAAFWQAHRDLPQALVDLTSEHVKGGDTWWDLYGGSGLLAAAAASAGAVRIELVERDARATAAALSTFAGDPRIHVHQAEVSSWLSAFEQRARSGGEEVSKTTWPYRPDGVILDPPRAGAGEQVCRTVCSAQPRVIVYVACDPATLARDIKTMDACGYGVIAVVPVDAFPMTHHVETVAVLTPVRMKRP